VFSDMAKRQTCSRGHSFQALAPSNFFEAVARPTHRTRRKALEHMGVRQCELERPKVCVPGVPPSGYVTLAPVSNDNHPDRASEPPGARLPNLSKKVSPRLPV